MSKIILSLSFFFVSGGVFAQYSVHGQVFDAQTDLPLANATVFIANTTKGTTTDPDGKFEIHDLDDIHYNLVVSFLGYEPVVFDLVPGGSIDYQVRLKPTVNVLDEVVVRAKKFSKAESTSYITHFKDNFIGFSDNAGQCSFENQDALLFATDNDVLLAFCDSVLVMRNEGLGYKIKIILQRYEYNSQKNSVLFEGQMAYEPLKTTSERKKKRWAKNRLKAYYGSQMHFFRALYNHRLNEEGFYFFFPGEPGAVFQRRSPALHDQEVTVKTITDYSMLLGSRPSVDDEDVLQFDDALSVVYINEKESLAYHKKRFMTLTQSIQRSALRSYDPAVVFPDGRLYPIEAAEASGYWSWELMSERLPLDYDPNVDLAILATR
jgi:hypothetical protein